MNRRFKVLFTFVALLFVTLTLVACTNQTKKDTNAVAEAKESLVVEFTAPDTAASVTQDVTLKAKEGEVDVTWVSNNTAVITNAGVVTRPEADTVVELTATLKKGEATDSKKFSLTVKAAEVVVDPDIAIVAGVKDALALGFATGDTAAAVTQNLTLKTTEEGVAITWASDKTAVITNAGVVTRPAEDAAVKLTATLTKGAVKETKVFDVTVLAAEVVETGAKAALVAHYADTFEDVEWLATEDVVLVDKITGSDDNDYEVTWEIITGDNFFELDGTVTRPTFTEGDKTIQLRASIEDGSTYDFFFTIKSLDQTDEEKVIAALNQVTAGQVFPSGYQELNFVTVETVKIGDEDVNVTWESSDTTVMTDTGELVAFEDAEFKEVTLTATITYKGVTKSKVVEFKVLGVKTFTNFNDALSTENFTVVSGDVIGAKVKVEGVALYKDIEDGFYLVSEGNRLGFVYGTRNADVVKEGKLYDVTFNVDVYYGTYQIKGASFSNERGGEIPTVTPLEVTLEDIVTLPKPSNTTPNHHTLYKLVNVEARIDTTNDEENYNTFFVPVGLEAEEVLTDQNSIMIYYKSDLDVIKSLNGQTILSIEVINNGYRTNNIVWNVNFIGSIDDVELDLTVEDRVSIIKNGFEAAIPASILKNMELDLPTTKDEATITWESTNLDVIALDGKVTLPAESTTVTLTATIVLEDVTEVFEKEVEIDVLPTTTIADALLSPAANKELFKVEGIVTGISSNNTYSFEDASGAIAIFSSVKLDVGFEYILFGTRDAYNGLEQLRYVDAIKGEAKALPAAAVLTEANLTNEVLLPLQSRLVSIENATVTTANKDSNGNISLTLTVGSKTINLRWDSRVVLPAGAADHLESIKQGAIVNIVSAPLGWFNNPQLGYNDASQIVIPVAETDEEKVNAAALALELPTVLATAAPLTLPLEGEYEVEISWASSHVDIIAADGTVVLPATDTEVTLTATLTLGVVTKDVEFVITVVSSDGMTVAMARAATGNVVVQGIVTGIANYDESGDVKYIFLSDADGTTIALFNPTDAESLVLGDLVKVTGSRAAYRGLEQIAAGSTVVVLESGQTVPAATVLTEFPTFTADDQGKRYSIEGLTVVSASGRDLRVTDGTTEVLVYVDIDKEALKNHIATAVGKKVDLVNIHLGWFNGSQFLMFNTSEVVIHELTDQEKLDADKAALKLAAAYTEEFTLPIAGANGSVITWVADPASSLADGKLVIPTEGEVEVTLTATIKLGELEDTKVFTVTLKELGEVEEELLYSIDFEGGTQNGYLRNVDTTLGVEGGLNWHIATETTSQSGVLWNYNATQDTNITAEQGLNIARLDGRNETTITSDAISNVTKLVFDAKFYGTRTDSNLKVQIKVGDGEFVDAFTVNLASTFNTFTVNINEENVQIRFVATGERSNLDNIRIYG